MIRENLIETNENLLLDKTINLIKLIELENTKNIYFRNFVLKTFGKEQNKIKAVWKYVRDNFDYMDDLFEETLIAPKHLINIRKGDCDDFALFIKTCYNILGIKSNYMLCGKSYNEFSHIVVITHGIIVDGTNSEFNYLSNEYINRVII